MPSAETDNNAKKDHIIENKSSLALPSKNANVTSDKDQIAEAAAIMEAQGFDPEIIIKVMKEMQDEMSGKVNKKLDEMSGKVNKKLDEMFSQVTKKQDEMFSKVTKKKFPLKLYSSLIIFLLLFLIPIVWISSRFIRSDNPQTVVSDELSFKTAIGEAAEGQMLIAIDILCKISEKSEFYEKASFQLETWLEDEYWKTKRLNKYIETKKSQGNTCPVYKQSVSKN